MSKWIEVKLKDVCEKVTVGHVGSMADQYHETGIPFLRSLNIKPYRIDFNNLKFIDEQFNQKLKKSVLKANDVAIIRTGYPGTACVIPKSLGIANCSDLVIVRPGKQLNPYFLASIFNSTFGKDLVSGNLVGAAQQHFNITVAKELKLRLPPKNLQDKIAAVLSAYDDLIENNDRRITLLEKMAEEIYREWFVRLRFPGHEQAIFHKGIPEGWTWETLENLGFLGRGKSKHRPRNDLSLYGGDYPFIQTGDVKEASSSFYINNHIQTYNKKGLAQSKLWNPGTLLITIAANIAETAILTYSACIPDSIIGFVPNHGRISAEYIKYSVEHLKTRIQNISQGTTQDNLSQSKLETFRFLVPSQITMNQFVEVSQPLFLQIKNLLLKNHCLKQTRDRLLTRLISGKLSAEDLDIQFPPSMTTDP
jgi:type I restriction enzyme, S subunit